MVTHWKEHHEFEKVLENLKKNGDSKKFTNLRNGDELKKEKREQITK